MDNKTTPTPKKKQPDEAKLLFDMQMDMAKSSAPADRILIAVFLVFLFLFGILTLALPPKTFSDQENRALEPRPKIQSTFNGSFGERIKAGKFLDRYFNGKFQNNLADYYSDHIPGRNLFVGVKGFSEIAMGKSENNGVYLGKGGYQLSAMPAPVESTVRANLDAAARFADAMGKEGLPTTFAVAGRCIDVMKSRLPALCPTYNEDAAWTMLEEQSAANGIKVLDLKSVLIPHAEAGEDIMYRTDHHWTTLGAYYAYLALCEEWGIEPYHDFQISTVTDSFYGTTWRKAGMKWVKPDTIEFYRFEGDTDYTMTIHDTEATFAGFYDTSYLEATDKYSAFISGNNAHVTIEKNGGEGRERMLLVKDSFGHSLAPFLARHFDLEIIDLRYYKLSAADLAKETGCSRVLIINNMDSIASGRSAVLAPLTMGLEN